MFWQGFTAVSRQLEVCTSDLRRSIRFQTKVRNTHFFMYSVLSLIITYRKAIHSTIAPTVGYKELGSDDENLSILSRDRDFDMCSQPAPTTSVDQKKCSPPKPPSRLQRHVIAGVRELRKCHVARHRTLFWESVFFSVSSLPIITFPWNLLADGYNRTFFRQNHDKIDDLKGFKTMMCISKASDNVLHPRFSGLQHL